MKSILFLSALAFFSGINESSAMMGARLDTTYQAVGSLKAFDTDAAFCTATLIAPDWIVTATHCRDGGSDESGFFTYRPSQMEFMTGPDSTKPTQKVKLKKWVHAGKYLGYSYGDKTNIDIDIIFAELERPLDITPIPLKMAPNFAPRAGVSYEILGYGVSDIDSYEGKRQKAPYSITTVEGNAYLNIFRTKESFKSYLAKAHPGEEEALDKHLALGMIPKGFQVHGWDARGRENGKFSGKPKGGWGSSCNGDSGGPLLQNENGSIKVAGVISGGHTGETEGCVRLGSRISIVDPKTSTAILKNKIPQVK